MGPASWAQAFHQCDPTKALLAEVRCFEFCAKTGRKTIATGVKRPDSTFRTLDLIGRLAYENAMSRKDAQKDGNQSRDQRLKNALKQNLQRRKSQAKARSSAEDTADRSEAEDKGQNG